MRSSSVGRRGFTLIELLLVIGIIAILASIVIIAINPTKQLGTARDAQRRSDVNTILNAVYQYSIDNSGALPGDIPVTPADAKPVCLGTVTGAACTDAPVSGVDLSDLTGPYLVDIPQDPNKADATTTGYTIVKDANDRITVAAVGEQTASISVTR
ncbi:MAG: prepilin-type N-terminal cleavage/methylation domain-containing protein [Candidatus Peribacteraceae bacterium]|nr:prepilin-type N-terminal cleavage/methylation domain-containing protein [Candidatus Peribacteraceae bacterium]